MAAMGETAAAALQSVTSMAPYPLHWRGGGGGGGVKGEYGVRPGPDPPIPPVNHPASCRRRHSFNSW